MDRKMTRRQAIKAGAAVAAATALPAFPYPAGIGPAPTMADATTTELTDEDRDWMRRRLTRNEWGQRVVGTEDQTVRRSWHEEPTPLHIAPDSRSYYPVFEFIRRSEGQRQAWPVSNAVKFRTEWIWSTPEPMRVALQAFAEDLVSVVEAQVYDALSNVLFGHLEDTYQRNSGAAAEDDDWTYQDYTDEERIVAFHQPVPLATVLLALCDQMRIDPSEWLNDRDLALLQRAT